MAYAFTNSKGVTYYLHTRKDVTKTGKERTLFYFAREVKEGALDAVPEGYKPIEVKTGMVVLKKTGDEAEPVMEAAPEAAGE